MSDIEPKDRYYHDLFQPPIVNVNDRDFSSGGSSSSSSFLTMHNNNNSQKPITSTTSGPQGFDHNFGTSSYMSSFITDDCLVQDPMEYYNSFSTTPFGLSSSSSEVLDGYNNPKPLDHHQSPVMNSPPHDHSSISSSSTEAGGGDHQEDSSSGKKNQKEKGSEDKDQEDDNNSKKV